MRVIVNGLSCAGSKTGVGHYTSQLLRCLQAQCEPEDLLDVFPQGLVGWAYNLGSPTGSSTTAPAFHCAYRFDYSNISIQALLVK